MTKTEAIEIIGGLSSPSKMPSYSFSIPASKCITGTKLRNVKGSVCSKCYAMKGMYRFPVVKNALMKRFDNLTHPQWVEAMTFLINKVEKSGYFRFLDSGDIVSKEFLNNIIKVCRNLPHIKFWLPTREYGIVTEYLKDNTFPDNLTVRLSSYMLEGKPPTGVASRYNLPTSGVSKGSFNCPASHQDNKCQDCRACWDKDEANINYKQH